MKIVTRLEDMPSKEHYVILEFSSRQIPGDQRSKDAPGHGYPAHSEAYTQYHVTADQGEWKKEITRRTINKDRFVAFKAGPLAKIELKAEVTIKHQ